MDANERHAFITRVEAASGAQAKAILRCMILKCTVTHTTIARAIRDAVERHGPTPAVIYEEQEPSGDEEPSLPSSHRKSKKKKKGEEVEQVAISENEVEASNTLNQHRSRSGREKKTKLKGKSRVSGEQAREQNAPKSSSPKTKAKKTKDKSLNHASKQRESAVIDLITPSDGEDHTLAQPASPRGIPARIFDSQGGDSEDREEGVGQARHADSRDVSEKQQVHPLPKRAEPSLGGSRKSTIEPGAKIGHGGHGTPSVPTSIEEPGKQHESNKFSSSGLEKKRKALEPTVEDGPSQPRKTASHMRLVKRAKQSNPQEAHAPSVGRKCTEAGICTKCNIWFLISELGKHRQSCKGTAATLTVDRHHVPRPRANYQQRNQSRQTQKARISASDTVTAESQKTVQLSPLEFPRGTRAGQDFSETPPDFVQGPNRFPLGPTPVPMSLARSDGGAPPEPSYRFRLAKPAVPSGVSPGHQSPPVEASSSWQPGHTTSKWIVAPMREMHNVV
jgi:hypothetical protein